MKPKQIKLNSSLYLPPEVSQASVCSDLLHSLQIFTELVVEGVGHHLTVFTIFDIFLPVEEPVWDLVLAGVLYYCHNSLNLGGKEK